MPSDKKGKKKSSSSKSTDDYARWAAEREHMLKQGPFRDEQDVIDHLHVSNWEPVAMSPYYGQAAPQEAESSKKGKEKSKEKDKKKKSSKK